MTPDNRLISEAEALGLKIKRFENLESLDVSNGGLTTTITLCPLYTGDLHSSRLISPPQSLTDSRVVGKWKAGVNLLRAIHQSVDPKIGIKTIFTFADLGVISSSLLSEDPYLLEYHEQLYRQAAARDVESLNIGCEFGKYSDYHSNFPRFISSGRRHDDVFSSDREIGYEGTRVIGELIAEEIVFDCGPIVVQKLVRKMLLEFGRSLTRGLLRQYGTFDAMTSRPGALNSFFERSKLLLNITDLFPHRSYPRLDVLC